MTQGIHSLLVPLIAAAVAAGGWLLLAARERRRPRRAPSQAGSSSGATTVIRLALGLAMAAVVWRLSDRPALAGLLLIVWLGAIRLLRSRARHRQAMQEEQNAIEAIGAASRALRAGIPVGGMLDFLATEGRGEAGRSFREIVHRESLGESMPAAIRHVLLTSGLSSLRAFGLTLLSQIDSGGDIADTTDRLARALIDRARVRRRARTIMAYTRAAATLMAVLPAIVVPMMCYLLEDYAQFMLRTPTGNTLLAISACLVVGGTLLMQRLSQLEPARSGVIR